MSKKNKGKKKRSIFGTQKWEEIKRNMDYFRLTGKSKQRKPKKT